MLHFLIEIPLTIAALGAGLMAGVYFAFSGFIMHSFDRLGPEKAADAMNAINEVILHSWFMGLFVGSSALYAALAGWAVLDDDLGGRWWLFAAGMIYLVGMFACTALFNVPLNNRLAKTGDNLQAKVETWPHYFKYWTRWNHLRAGSALLSLVLSIRYLTIQG